MIYSLSKRFICVIFTLCIFFCIVPFACAQESTPQPKKLEIVLPTSEDDTHVENTPQYSDTLKAEISPSGVTGGKYSWYRFYNVHEDEYGNEIPAHYDLVGTGSSYVVAEQDIGHTLKCEFTYGSLTLTAETEPVTKLNPGKLNLKVKDNTYYGDTDGCVYYLDQRMEYSHDGITKFDVVDSLCSLPSGENNQNLSEKGYTWMVRYKGTNLVMEGEWETFTIKQGEKIDCSSVSVEKELTLTPSDNTKHLAFSASPEHAYVAYYSWTSSDESVATVDWDGNVTAVDNGHAVITCTVNGGNPNGSVEQTASCDVTVKGFHELQSADIALDKVAICLGEEKTLDHSINQPDVEDYTEEWTTSDENVVSIDNGKIKALAVGDAVITYTVTKDDISVSDDVAVSVGEVKCVSTCNLAEGQNLEFDFINYPIGKGVVVTVYRDGNELENVPEKYYDILGDDKLLIHNDYLSSLGVGSYAFNFIMPEENKKEVSEEGGEKEAPEIVSSSYNGKAPIITLLRGTGKSVVITKAAVLEENAGVDSSASENSTSDSGVTAMLTFVVSPTITPEKQQITITQPLDDDTPISESNIIIKNGATVCTDKFNISATQYNRELHVNISPKMNKQFTDGEYTMVVMVGDEEKYSYAFLMSGFSSTTSVKLTPSETAMNINTGILVENPSEVSITILKGEEIIENEKEICVTPSISNTQLQLNITPKKSNNVINDAYIVTATIKNSEVSSTVIVDVVGFLDDDTEFITDDITAYCHKLDLTDYLFMDATYADLKADPNTTIQWYLNDDPDMTENEYCSIDENGIVTLKQDMGDESVAVNLIIKQKSSIYTGEKTFTGRISSVKIDFYKLLDRSNQGIWEPLGRVGLDFVFGGDYYYTNTGRHPKVTITDSSGNKIPISYWAIDSKFGYRVFNLGDNMLEVELPYLFLRTCHVGTYNITFEFYGDDDKTIEETINSDFKVLSTTSTPYTGDDFHILPYVSILILSSSTCGIILNRYKRKHKISKQ